MDRVDGELRGKKIKKLSQLKHSSSLQSSKAGIKNTGYKSHNKWQANKWQVCGDIVDEIEINFVSFRGTNGHI